MKIAYTGLDLPEGKIRYNDSIFNGLAEKFQPEKVSPYYFEFLPDDYEAADVTAAATFYMAEIYFDFSQSLLDSERPADLDPAQMQDYEMVLEEEAFPFEERAIEVHEKNLELLAVGVFNPWIEKSLEKLADMMPGRYAKFEGSTGLIGSIDQYAYRSPNARAPSTDETEVDDGVETGEPAATPDPDNEAESASSQRADQDLAAR